MSSKLPMESTSKFKAQVKNQPFLVKNSLRLLARADGGLETLFDAQVAILDGIE
jgi:hypothetical protein